MPSSEIIVKIHTSKEMIESHIVKTHAAHPSLTGKAVHIKARSNVNYELIEKTSGYAPENIATKRVGKDLHIAFEGDDINDPDLIIDGYYDYSGELIVGEAENGQYYNYVPESAQTSDAVSGLSDGAFAGQALGGDGYLIPFWMGMEPFSTLGLLGGIVAAIGGIAAVAGGGESNSVTVASVNDTPAISGDIGGIDNEDTAITGALSATDADGMTDNTYFTVTGTATNGTATINAATGAWSYTPNADYNGSDSFTVTITDDQNNTATQTISLTVSAAADITNDTLSTNEDTAITANVLTGTNGATADSFEGTPSITAVTQGTNGTVVNNNNGTITYTPNANFHGSDSYTYTVTSGGVTETATVNVTVASVNEVPTATPSISGGDEDTNIIVDLAGTDMDGTITSVTVTTLPPVGEGVLYLADGTTAVVAGAALTPIQATGLIFVPSLNFNGDVTIPFTVTDNDGTTSASANEVITVNDVNDAPTAEDNSIGLAKDTTDILTAADFGFSDVDGDLLASVKITTLETDGSLLYFNGISWIDVTQDQVISKSDIDNGYLAFKPNATETGVPYTTFEFTVNDGHTDSTTPNTITYDIGNALSVSNPLPVDEGKSAVFIIELSGIRATDTVLALSIGGDVDGGDYTTPLQYLDANRVWQDVAGNEVTILAGQTQVEVKVKTIQNDDDNSGDGNTVEGTEPITLTATINGGTNIDMANTTAMGQTTINDYPSLFVSAPISVTEGNEAIFEVSLSASKSTDTIVSLTLSGEVDTADYTTTQYFYSTDDGSTWTTVLSSINGTTITIPASVASESRGVLVKVATTSNNDASAPDRDETMTLIATTSDSGIANTTASDSTIIVEPILLSVNEEKDNNGDTSTTLAANSDYTYALIGQGANGTVTQSGSDVIYTPDTDFSGTDSFKVMKTDTAGVQTESTVTVTVTATADTPTIDMSVNNKVTSSIPGTTLINELFSASSGWQLSTATGPNTYTSGTSYTLGAFTPAAGVATLDSKQFIVKEFTSVLSEGSYSLTFAQTGTAAYKVYFVNITGSVVTTVGELTNSGGTWSTTLSSGNTANAIIFTNESTTGNAKVIIDNVLLDSPSSYFKTYDVNIINALNDTDSASAQSEALQDVTLVVKDSGGTIIDSAGYFNQGTYNSTTKTWTFTQAQLVGLKITVADTLAAAGFNLEAVATSTELSNIGSTATATATITVTDSDDAPIIGNNDLVFANQAGFTGTLSGTIDTYFSTDGGGVNTFTWEELNSALPEIYADGKLVTITYDDATGTVTGKVGTIEIFHVTIDMINGGSTVTYVQSAELLGVKERIDGGIVLPGGGNSDSVVIGFNNADESPSGVDAIIVAHNLIEDSAAEILSPIAEHTVNTNNFYIGVDSNNMTAGAQLIFDFATAGVDYDGVSGGDVTHANDVAEIEIKLFNFGSEKSGDELFITIHTATSTETILLTQDQDYTSELEYTVKSSNGEAITSVEFLAGNESSFKLGIQSISAIKYDKDFDMQLGYQITDADGDSDSGMVTISMDGDLNGDNTMLYDASKTAIDGGSGFDTLLLPSAGLFDFSALALNVDNMEALDLSVGDHSLSNITYNDILEVTDTDRDLWIFGDASDNVTFASGNGWSQSATTIAETFNSTSHTFYEWTNSNDSSIMVKVESVI